MTTPASAPTSPAVTRISKATNAGVPVTPQHKTRPAAPATAAGKLQHTGFNKSLMTRTPMNPAGALTAATTSPFTPQLSNQSISSSDASILATPPPSTAPPLAALSIMDPSEESPELGSVSLPEKKLSNGRAASDAANWRSRASQNGIRVAPSTESQFADDEDSEPNMMSPTKPSARSMADANILPPSFSSTHRRSRSTIQQSTNKTPSAPQQDVQRTPDRRKSLTTTNFNTPPPKSNVLDRIKMKGMMTAPAQPRRRDPYGPLFDIDENEYIPVTHSFSAATQSLGYPDDPFEVSLQSIAELVPEAFEEDDLSFDAAIDASQQQAVPKSCSVCDNVTPRLAVLKPCAHPLCSACLTSALNIVGEKDMRCSVCSNAVEDFKLQTFAGGIVGSPQSNNEPATSTPPTNKRSGLLPSPFSDTKAPMPSAFSSIFDGVPSTTVSPETRRTFPVVPGENIVLRIDNVPWDITPPMIAQWLKQPVEIVHVLLDRKGKTLSHAYVEVADEETFKAALRGAQNSVLGKGRRARGVTVTRSTQEEVMRALFPSWQGNFSGAMPTVAGLVNEHAVSALEHGMVTQAELNSLLHLIRSPDSHFLKVPSLPFHSLISILYKFPAGVDGHLPWPNAIRNMMFDVAFAAVQVMIPRVTDNQTSENIEILSKLFETAISCEAFTALQSKQIADMLDHTNGLKLNIAVSSRVPQPSIAQPTHDFPRNIRPLSSNRLPVPAPAQMNNLNLGLGLPSGFSRGGLGNGVQLPIHQHVPSMPVHLPSMNGQQFLQMPMPSPQVAPAYHPRQDFRSFSADYAMHGPHGMQIPNHMGMNSMVGPTRYDMIAREFNMDAQLVEALAQRLGI